MNASEMTNKELAKRLETHIVPISGCVGSRSLGLEIAADVGEAARRLRKVTIRTDNSGVIAELQRRLKIAEDALEVCVSDMCVTCSVYNYGGKHKGCQIVKCYQMRTAEEALAAIRGEGGAR